MADFFFPRFFSWSVELYANGAWYLYPTLSFANQQRRARPWSYFRMIIVTNAACFPIRKQSFLGVALTIPPLTVAPGGGATTAAVCVWPLSCGAFIGLLTGRFEGC